jgi:signal transduction histidine kinase
MTDVDLNIVLLRALRDFDLLIQEKNATLHHDKLPHIRAVPVQMHQLFHNLLSNALKFTVPSVPPQVSITVRQLSIKEIKATGSLDPDLPYCDIIFTDNGIGFEKEFADKIFAIFSRLHDKQTYSGTGIGLALCKKIVSNHNGIIYAQSVPGKGSSFHVVLPCKSGDAVRE